MELSNPKLCTGNKPKNGLKTNYKIVYFLELMKQILNMFHMHYVG